MSRQFSRFEQFLNNGKNFYVIYFFLVVFLLIVKLPSLVETDIQPWDEGMYAIRVLSIHVNGDFIDQSSHSVGGFYSASHPPLLMWIGYLATSVFGINAVTFKLTIFIFSLLCVLLIMLMGKLLFTNSVGVYAALIFCGNILFAVFSQRFQFDIPYTFFILLSFYLFIIYNNEGRKSYLILSAIAFGCCLMTKILVGFFIPMILTLSYFFIRETVKFTLKDIIVLTITGVLIALPWHAYMLSAHGKEFTDYFLGFHLYQRALIGVEQNEKASGVLYHINYILSIIPFSIILLFAFFRDVRNFKLPDWKKIFLWIWFLTGLLIISVFRTKLQSYLFLILIPACYIIPLYLQNVNSESVRTKVVLIICIFLNLIWFATEFMRPEIKNYFTGSGAVLHLLFLAGGIILLLFVSYFTANRIELKKTLYLFIFVFFLANNFYYLLNVPQWLGYFQSSKIRDIVVQSKRNKIVYVGTNHRFNPQFSYYFGGANLNWEKSTFDYELLDNKNGLANTKDKLQSLPKGEYFFIVEKDGLNRANYDSSLLFIPHDAKLKKKTNGYELYEN